MLASNVGDFVPAQAVTLRSASGTAEINLDLQLTVTDALGRRPIVPVQMQVANLTGASRRLCCARGKATSSAPQTRACSGQTGTSLTDSMAACRSDPDSKGPLAEGHGRTSGRSVRPRFV